MSFINYDNIFRIVIIQYFNIKKNKVLKYWLFCVFYDIEMYLVNISG